MDPMVPKGFSLTQIIFFRKKKVLLKYNSYIRKIEPFKVCNSVIFSIFIMLCSHCQYLVPEYLHQPRKKKPQTSQFPLPYPLAATNLCLCYLFVIFHTHGIMYHIVFCVWLFCCCLLNIGFIHVACVSTFLKKFLNNNLWILFIS